MKFCSSCGNDITIKIPNGDNRERHVCDDCDTVHYQNPRIITGCLPTFEDKILLCKRAIEPRLGLWTLPAGFMENGETTEQGAIRESWEEAKTELTDDISLYCIFDVPEINQVFFFYRCELTNADSYGVGEESLEVELFSEEDIPWHDLAFYTVHKTLEYFLSDKKKGDFTFRSEELIRPKKFYT